MTPTRRCTGCVGHGLMRVMRRTILLVLGACPSSTDCAIVLNIHPAVTADTWQPEALQTQSTTWRILTLFFTGNLEWDTVAFWNRLGADLGRA